MSEETKAGKIFQAIPKIMGEMEPIRKDRKNAQQGFMFRGIEDMYNALQGVLSRNGVFTVPRVLKREEIVIDSKSGGKLTRVIQEIVFRFFADDGSFIDVGPIYGEAMDSGDKATNKSNSIAQKYAFLMVFAIPTEDQDDPDKESHQPNWSKPAQTITPKAPISKENAAPLGDQKPVATMTRAEPKVVTMPQLKRLAAIANQGGWKHEQVSELIRSKFGLTTSKELTMKQYELIVDYVEQYPPTGMNPPPPPPKSDPDAEWDEFMNSPDPNFSGKK